MSTPRKFKNPVTGSEFTLADIQGMIDMVEAEGRNLSKYEETFITGMALNFPKYGTITENQLVLLERLYANKTN